MAEEEVQNELGIDYDLAHAEFDSEQFEADELIRNSELQGLWNFYDGEHRTFLKVSREGVDDNVIINLCSVLVDRSTSRLFGDPLRGELLTFNIEKKEDVKQRKATKGEGKVSVPVTDQTKAKAFLEDVYARSGGLDKIYNSIGVYGAVTGHFIFKLTLEEGEPRVITVDPQIFSVLTRADDKDKTKAYKIQFPIMARDPRDNNIKETEFRQLILHGPDYGGPEGWHIQDFHRFTQLAIDPDERVGALEDTDPNNTANEHDWVAVGDIESWRFNPIIDGQNLPHARAYWGQSDMKNVTGINDEINFVMSNVNRIIRFHAHPRTVGIGIEANNVQETAVESFWSIATTPDKAKIQNLEMQSDLPAVFNFFTIMREAFWTIGREADPSTFKEKIGNVTNFGLRVLFLDALNKLGQKRQTYGKALTLLLERCLELGDMADLTAVPNWTDPLPTDPREAAETLMIERDIGIVSKETAATERGRKWEQEKERIEQEPDPESVEQQMMRTLRGDSETGRVSRT
jgi:hypothetical protein